MFLCYRVCENTYYVQKTQVHISNVLIASFVSHEYAHKIHTCSTLVMFTAIFNKIRLKGCPHFDKLGHAGLKWAHPIQMTEYTRFDIAPSDAVVPLILFYSSKLCIKIHKM